MTFSRLFDLKWEAWNLRNPFYPMVFIYPVQAGLKFLGVTDPRVLISSGAMVVIFFSALNIYLTFRIVASMYRNAVLWLFAAFFLVFSQFHIAIASTVLPRTISTTFLLAAFLFIIERPKSHVGALAAGILLGFGAIIRFSEMIFIVPFVIYLFLERRILHSFIMGGAMVITAGVLLGTTDYLYWGSPFYSLKNVFDYMVVKTLPPWENQPVLYYLTHFHEWTNLFLVIFAVIAIKWKNRYIALCAFLPILLLSVLTHKQARYLVPMLPFWSALVAIGMYRWLGYLVENQEGKSATLWKKVKGSSVIFVFVFTAALLMEVDGYRFRRSESAVDIARYIARQGEVESVAIEQKWKAGSILYLHHIPVVMDIDTERIHDLSYFTQVIETPGLRYISVKAQSLEKFKLGPILEERGFKPLEVGQEKRDKYCLYVSGK